MLVNESTNSTKNIILLKKISFLVIITIFKIIIILSILIDILLFLYLPYQQLRLHIYLKNIYNYYYYY